MGWRPGGTPGSVQPHIPSFPAIPAKNKGRGGGSSAGMVCAGGFCGSSWAAVLAPAAPSSCASAAVFAGRVVPGALLRLGGEERDAGAQSKCGLRGCFCSLSSPAVMEPVYATAPESRPRDDQRCCKALGCPSAPAHCPSCSFPAPLFPQSLLGAPLPSPRPRRQHPKERRAALGFGNLIRVVLEADASARPLAPSSVSQAGAKAAEQVWTRLLHGSGQTPNCSVPWKRAVSAGDGRKVPTNTGSKCCSVGTPRQTNPQCCGKGQNASEAKPPWRQEKLV